jgi:hypothetical protein
MTGRLGKQKLAAQIGKRNLFTAVGQMIKQPERFADRRFLTCAGSPGCRRLGRMELSQHNLPGATGCSVQRNVSYRMIVRSYLPEIDGVKAGECIRRRVGPV